jgi:hypothetical protein
VTKLSPHQVMGTPTARLPAQPRNSRERRRPACCPSLWLEVPVRTPLPALSKARVLPAEMRGAARRKRQPGARAPYGHPRDRGFARREELPDARPGLPRNPGLADREAATLCGRPDRAANRSAVPLTITARARTARGICPLQTWRRRREKPALAWRHLPFTIMAPARATSGVCPSQTWRLEKLALAWCHLPVFNMAPAEGPWQHCPLQ